MRRVPLILLVAFLLCSSTLASERARAVLVEHNTEILEASRSFGIAPRLLASIIFAEQSLNVKPGEDVLDKVLAMSGYNASVGIAQIKVETARWVYDQIERTSGAHYSPSKIPFLNSAVSDSLADCRNNCMYAAAYISLIVQTWKAFLDGIQDSGTKTGYIATLYCLGLVRQDGTVRQPHSQARMNHFGETARLFYDSFELTGEFPE